MNSTRALSNIFGFILLAAGVLYLLVAFKMDMSLARFSLGGALWVDLALAGLFSASGLLFLVRDKRVKQLMNMLAAVCFAALIAWGVFGMGK